MGKVCAARASPRHRRLIAVVSPFLNSRPRSGDGPRLRRIAPRKILSRAAGWIFHRARNEQANKGQAQKSSSPAQFLVVVQWAEAFDQRAGYCEVTLAERDSGRVLISGDDLVPVRRIGVHAERRE